MEKSSTSSKPIKATCHCGAITATVPGTPKSPINECQCTICRRYGAAWAYYNTTEVDIQHEEGSSTRKYLWNARKIEFHFCETCGCVMCWWPVEISEGGSPCGINSRMMDPDAIKYVNREVDFEALFV